MCKTSLLIFLIVSINSIGQKHIRTTKSLNYKQKYESAMFSKYSLMYEKIDPTVAFQLAKKAYDLDKSALNEKIMNDFFIRYNGTFYSKQFQQDDVVSLKFLPGDSLFLVGDMYQRIYLWNVRTKKKQLLFYQANKEVTVNPDDFQDFNRSSYGCSIAVNPSGNKFISSGDNEIAYWDIVKREFIKSYKFERSEIEKLSFLNDSMFICKFRTNDSTCIQVFSVNKDTCLSMNPSNGSYIQDILTLPSKNSYVSSSSDGFCNFWSPEKKDPVFKIKTPEVICSMAYNDQLGVLALGGCYGVIYLYDVHKNEFIRDYKISEYRISSLSMNSHKLICISNGLEIFSLDLLDDGKQKSINIHKVKTRESHVVEMGLEKDVFISFTNNGYSGNSGPAYRVDNFIRLWQLNKSSIVKKESIRLNDSCFVAIDFKRKVGIIDQKKHIDSNFYLSDLNTGKIIDSIKENYRIINTHISPNVKYLAYQLMDGTVKVLDLAKRDVKFEKKLNYRVFVFTVNDVTDEILFINQSKYGKYEVWNFDTSKQVKYIEHEEIADGATYSKDGNYLLVYGWNYYPNHNVSLYDTKSCKLINTYQNSQRSINYSMISKKGNYVVNLSMFDATEDGYLALNLLEGKTGKIISPIKFRIDNKLEFYPSEIDDEMIVLSRNDSAFYTWSMSPSLTESIHRKLICDFDSSFYNFEDLSYGLLY